MREVADNIDEGVITWVAKLIPAYLLVELGEPEHGDDIRVGIVHGYLECCCAILILGVLISSVLQ